MSSNPLIRRAKYALRFLPDEAYIQLYYFARFHRFANLKSPRTFNEKLQWLKLYDRNPLYTTLVDKVAVKPWVAERIGWEHIVPTLGVWDSFDEIDFDSLPESFVLKCTHDSEGLVIVPDKSKLDVDGARAKLTEALGRNFYYIGREWPYKDVPPRILAEEYLDSAAATTLPDYKLFRFTDGTKVTLVCENRELGAKMNETFFTDTWEALSLTEGGHPSNPAHPVPEHFTQMKALCDQLAVGLPFARVDFYESSRGLLFGEMTLYPNSGFEHFDPASTDAEWGEWIKLPETAGGGVALYELQLRASYAGGEHHCSRPARLQVLLLRRGAEGDVRRERPRARRDEVRLLRYELRAARFAAALPEQCTRHRMSGHLQRYETGCSRNLEGSSPCTCGLLRSRRTYVLWRGHVVPLQRLHAVQSAEMGRNFWRVAEVAQQWIGDVA